MSQEFTASNQESFNDYRYCDGSAKTLYAKIRFLERCLKHLDLRNAVFGEVTFLGQFALGFCNSY